MKVQDYVKENWERLPKSSFNGEEVVIVEIVQDEDYGYGNHDYEGWGVDAEGNTIWAYSSGCSCNGKCSIEHRDAKDVKIFKSSKEFKEEDWDTFNFASLQVEFNDY